VTLGSIDPAACDGKHYKIGYDTWSDTEAFAVEVNNGLKAAASQMGCVDLVKLVDNADPGTAVSNVRTLVQEHVDGVMLFQVVAAANNGIAKILNAAKIPAISISASAPGITFVFPNESAAGRQAGIELGKAGRQRFGSTLPYVLLGGFPEGGANVVARMNGVLTGVRQAYPDLPSDHIITIDTKADPPTANANTLNALGNVPSGAPLLVSGISDPSTNAMYQAVAKDGRASQSVVVPIGGANPSGLRYVCQYPAYAGVLSYLPETNAKYMISALMARLHGQSVPSSIYTPVAYLTRQNMRQTYPSAPC
jgi:ABC-type sugar transport system substrate-binding protein